MATISARDCFVANVRREMTNRNWTQVELAKRCGLPQPRISSLLSGGYGTKIELLDVVATAFGLQPSALLMPPPEDNS